MSCEVIDIWVDQPFRFIAVICLLVFFRCIIHCSELKSILSPFEQQQKLKELKHSVSACLAFMDARVFMVLLGCGGGLSRGHIWVFLFHTNVWCFSPGAASSGCADPPQCARRTLVPGLCSAFNRDLLNEWTWLSMFVEMRQRLEKQLGLGHKWSHWENWGVYLSVQTFV